MLRLCDADFRIDFCEWTTHPAEEVVVAVDVAVWTLAWRPLDEDVQLQTAVVRCVVGVVADETSILYT